jgi:hypothetical protein
LLQENGKHTVDYHYHALKIYYQGIKHVVPLDSNTLLPNMMRGRFSLPCRHSRTLPSSFALSGVAFRVRQNDEGLCRRHFGRFEINSFLFATKEPFESYSSD